MFFKNAQKCPFGEVYLALIIGKKIILDLWNILVFILSSAIFYINFQMDLMSWVAWNYIEMVIILHKNWLETQIATSDNLYAFCIYA